MLKHSNVNSSIPLNLSFNTFEVDGSEFIRDGILFETFSGLAFKLSENDSLNIRSPKVLDSYKYLCIKQDPVSMIYTGISILSDIQAIEEQQKKDNFLTFIDLQNVNLNNDIITIPEDTKKAKLEPNFQDLARPIVRVSSGNAVQNPDSQDPPPPYMTTRTNTFFSNNFSEYFILNTVDGLTISQVSSEIETYTEPICYVNTVNNEIVNFS